ncbi:MAG: hypothetical protein QOE14_1402, partial [Humisphaera sp.]|nr:hypothetical protein [Humisphaera sp.]
MMSAALAAALKAARDTRRLELSAGALGATAAVFREQFPGAAAVVVADAETFPLAGRRVADALGAE